MAAPLTGSVFSDLDPAGVGLVPPLPAGRESTPTPVASSSVLPSVFETGVRRRTVMVVGANAEESILGRLHAAREVSIDLDGMTRLVQLSRQYLTAQPWTVDGDLFVSFRGGMRPLLHHGDLHVRGSLLIDDHSWLVCTGNLIVDGIISNYQPSTLAIGGSITAPRLVTRGSVVALHSIRIGEAALVRGTTPLLCGANFWTPTLIHEGPNVNAPALIVERSIDLSNPEQCSLHAEQFSLDALTEGGLVDPERCDRLLRCGLSLGRV